MKKKILIAAAVLIVILTGICVWYIADYYHVTDKDAVLADTETVKVSAVEFGYFFDGEGDKNALIFYPGAKVEDLAYADLMKRIAADGTDCFLVHMPCNFAFFGINKANDVMTAYNYDNWYLAGHSLGGAMAASYSSKNADKLDGLIFLAAYSTADLTGSGLKILSIYGSEDGVLSMEKLEQGRELMPTDYEEFQIDGGNHAGFGDYGEQSGDGKAEISGDAQRALTAEKISEFINGI